VFATIATRDGMRKFYVAKHTLENLIRNETYVMRDGRQGSVEYFVAFVRKETAIRAAGKDYRD